MPDVLRADKVIGRSLYANGSVNKYRFPGSKVIGTFSSGALIGVVFSYVLGTDGLYWSFNDAYNQLFYVKQSDSLDLPGKADILKEAAMEAEKKQRDDKGLLQYNIDKYGKWIIGGIVVAIALPTVIRSIQMRKTNAVSGTDNKKALLLLLLIGVGVYAYSQSKKKKRKGSIIVHPLDKGEFVKDTASQDLSNTLFYDATKFMAGNKRPSVYIPVPLTI